MIKIQEKLPQTILVKIKLARCLKDKISSGNFLIIVHALDRIGGNRIEMKEGRTEEEYRIISKHLRDFGIRKRKFLNAENRQIVQKDAAGNSRFVTAAATGMGFYKPGNNDDDEEEPGAALD